MVRYGTMRAVNLSGDRYGIVVAGERETGIILAYIRYSLFDLPSRAESRKCFTERRFIRRLFFIYLFSFLHLLRASKDIRFTILRRARIEIDQRLQLILAL